MTDAKFIAPGIYLVRAGEMTLDDTRRELSQAGLLFSRRFLVHAARSDYLVVFDQQELAKCSRVDVKATPPETPVGSWAALIKNAPEATPVAPKIEKVVAEPKTPAGTPPIQGKKTRPGRRARQMLKALIAASDIAPLVAVGEPPVVTPKITVTVPQVVTSAVPILGEDLLMGGSGGKPLLRFRPFHVAKTIEAEETQPGMMMVPHLTVYHPPRPGFTPHIGIRNKLNDKKALEHVDKCHTWIWQVIRSLEGCGALPADSCRVMLPQPDASRLSRGNLVALQCRFRDDLPNEIRNTVYSVLRGAVWFHSLPRDSPIGEDEQQYLVRCWWRQISVATE